MPKIKRIARSPIVDIMPSRLASNIYGLSRQWNNNSFIQCIFEKSPQANYEIKQFISGKECPNFWSKHKQN